MRARVQARTGRYRKNDTTPLLPDPRTGTEHPSSSCPSELTKFTHTMADNDTAVEKKRGRPKKAETGEKRPKEDASADAPKAKRGRGRPKGSSKKGKKTATKAAAGAKKGAGRGRPRKSAAAEADKDTGSDDAGEGSD
ncbi:hypothetical protein MRX96_012757 [Rhipicephalus microplus]